MPEDKRRNKRFMALVVFGILIAVLALFLPEQEDIAFEVVVNNTDLCDFNHTSGNCQGPRNSSTLYWANDSAIEIFLMSHANTAGANASIQLYINGTQVEHVSGRPLAAAEDNYKTITAIIPKGANYSAIFLNYHHYDWREYPILTGRNGTLSINQTIIQGGGGGVSFDGNPVNLNGSTLFNGTFNSTLFPEKVNKTSDTMTGNLQLNNATLIINRSINWTQANNITNGSMVVKNSGNITSVFRDIGVQFWFLHYSSPAFGYVAGDFGGVIGYSIPNGGVGLTMRNSTPGINQTVWQSQWMSNIYFLPIGNEIALCLAPGNTTASPTCKLRIYSNGSIQHPALIGTGNAAICTDANGYEYRGGPGC